MKIAKLHMDPQDKLRFEIHGKSSVKYHLKANHQVEAKRWFWALNNAIQWSKDEAREEQRRSTLETEAIRQAKLDQLDRRESSDRPPVPSIRSTNKSLAQSSGSLAVPSAPSAARSVSSMTADDLDNASGADPSEITRVNSIPLTNTIQDDIDEDEEYGDDASSHEAQPATKDAFNITAQSAKIQLDLLAQVSAALQSERNKNPAMTISDPIAVQALGSYEAAVGNLKGLVGDLLRISRDRDAYWQYRIDREADVRRMWEETMAHVAREQEALESRYGESEDKRKRTKRALRDALEASKAGSRPGEAAHSELVSAVKEVKLDDQGVAHREEKDLKTATQDMEAKYDISDSEDEEDDEEFFDAVDAGEVEVVNMPPTSPKLDQPEEVADDTAAKREQKLVAIKPSFKGYEDPPRDRFKLDADNRPKISLWVSFPLVSCLNRF
jgi:oxysterol-binding protein 1